MLWHGVRGFWTEPFALLVPPSLSEKVALYVSKQLQKSVASYPFLFLWIAVIPHAQRSVLEAMG